MTKKEFIETYSDIGKIGDLLIDAGNLFDQVPVEIQNAILNYHNAPATLQHCLRWGLQAAKEIREDWHTVIADIPCEDK